MSATATPLKNMVPLPGGTFRMGSDRFYPEERPVREVAVKSFWIDERPVTAAEFRRFVRETGYTTVAERPLDPADYPDADPEAPLVSVAGATRLARVSVPARSNAHNPQAMCLLRFIMTFLIRRRASKSVGDSAGLIGMHTKAV